MFEIDERKNDAAKKIWIGEGFKRVTEKGDVAVSVKVEEFRFQDLAQQTKTESRKGTDGKEVKTTQYYLAGQLSMPVGLVVMDGRTGRAIHTARIVPLLMAKPFETPLFANAAELNKYWGKEKGNVRKTLKKQCFNEALRTLSTQLTDRYAYAESRGIDHLWILDSKKHPEHEAFQQQWMVAEKALRSIRHDQALDAAKTQLQPTLA